MKAHDQNSKGNILLIFPDIDHPTKVFGVRARPYGPPLGILYLATELTRVGYSVKVVDFSAETYSKIPPAPFNKGGADVLRSLLANTDVVGITALSYSRNNFHELISEIHQFKPDLPIMIGGPDCNIEASFASMTGSAPRLPDGVDVMALGEAEHTIVSVVDALMTQRGREERLARCAGVIFKDRLTGKVRWGQPYQDFSDPEILSPPDFNLIDLKVYTLFGLNKRGITVPIITSRDCPHKCTFCTRAAQRPSMRHPFISLNFSANSRYRERSAENVLNEIQQLADAGFQVLYIVDDNFMVNEKRVHAIMDGIIKRGVKMAILAQGRVNPCSEALYQKMKAAGVRLLSYGLESGNQDVLDFYRKGTTIEQAQKALELADRCGIFTHGNFILGAPMETREHIERTIRFARELPLDAAFFSVLNYTYGSEIWDVAHRKGLIKVYESDVYADKERGLGQFSAQELERFCQKAHYRFYFRPKLWARYLAKMLRSDNKEFAKLLARGFLRFSADVCVSFWK
ncbi:MAG: B12-binding domain-containing radical SAM protein [Candidatus Poribacteria bacterium]